jgi:putative ABC transport system ATP-binding protein
MTALELDHVTRAYPGTPPVTALDDVTFSVSSGELLAIVGPSGSGKSTLLTIAGTLERPTTGHVRIDGLPVEHLTDRDLSAVRAHRIGFVFQQFMLVPTLSTIDNVASGLLYQGIRAEKRRRAGRVALEAVGLAHRAAHRPSELSGGECQRVAIARALVGSPSLILADEPTGNVDSRQSNEILSLLIELNRAGVTIVVVTHNPTLADALPRTVHLRDGHVEHDASRP